MTRGYDSKKTGQRKKFLNILRQTANVAEAARQTGLGYSAVYAIRRRDATFRAEWDDALQEAMDALEGEAYRRAYAGYGEYITCRNGLVLDGEGQPVMQKRYSDRLMTTLLKAHRPEKYSERSSIDLTVTENIAQAITEGRERVIKALK